jgi:hypothetical protein
MVSLPPQVAYRLPQISDQLHPKSPKLIRVRRTEEFAATAQSWLTLIMAFGTQPAGQQHASLLRHEPPKPTTPFSAEQFLPEFCRDRAES